MNRQAEPHVEHRAARRTAVRHAGLLFLLALLVYLPTLRNGFAYDDVPVIMLDTRVQGLDLAGIVTGAYWQDTTSALYRPLTTLTFALDWRIAGGTPAWFHFSNAMLHAVVTVLLFLVLYRLRVGAAVALIAAAIFAVHPVHVEAVANIVGRAELLAAAFTMAAALLWIGPTRRLRRLPGLALLLALFICAVLSKESALVLPGVLVVLDVARSRLRTDRMRAWLRLRVRPLGALAAAALVLVVARIVVLGTVAPLALDPALEVLQSPIHRTLTALQVWPQYARLLFYPRTLLADYGPRVMMPATTLQPLVVLGAALLAGCMLGGLLAWERRRWLLAAALLWFAVTILPVSNLIVPIGILVAERTLYLPSMALSFAAAAVAMDVMRAARYRAVATALTTVAAVAILLFTVRTMIRIPDWRSTDAILFATLTDRPDSYKATWHFARVAAARGDRDEAFRLQAAALDLWPWRRRLVQEAALYSNVHGAEARAQQLIDHGLKIWPDDLVLRRLHAARLLDGGDSASAALHIAEGLRYHPGDSLLHRMQEAVAVGQTGGWPQ